MDKTELMAMLQEYGFQRQPVFWSMRIVEDDDVVRLVNAILERAAVECDSVGWLEDVEYAERIRALKITEGGGA